MIAIWRNLPTAQGIILLTPHREDVYEVPLSASFKATSSN